MNAQRLVSTFDTLARMSSPTFKEAQIIRRINNKLKFLGVDIRIDDAAASFNGSCGNLIATLPASDDSFLPIALVAHVDTVDPCSKCAPVNNGSSICSDGTTVLGADDKAGVAIIIEILETLFESKKPHGLIQAIFTVAEEKGLLGAKYLDFDLIKSEDVIVLDGDGPVGSIITRAPSQESILIDITGKAAHAGVDPEKGVNAIHIAAKALAKLEFGRLDNESTSNVGMITGGTASNIVPDKAHVDTEVRSHNASKLVSYSNLIEEVFTATVRESGGSVDIVRTHAYDAFDLDPQARIIKRLTAAAASLSIETQTITSGGGSDANVFNSNGLTAVNLSVGYDDVHTVSESLDLKIFIKTAEMIETLVTQPII